MFRLQNNVPEVYVNESRDFQLFCRAYDSVFGGVKFSIDSLLRSSSVQECDSRLLELLRTKLGLFSDFEFEEQDLRFILSVFPILIRYKGSYTALHHVEKLFERIYTRSITFDYCSFHHVLRVTLEETIDATTTSLLKELLKFLLPAGVLIEFDFFNKEKFEELQILSQLPVNYNYKVIRAVVGKDCSICSSSNSIIQFTSVNTAVTLHAVDGLYGLVEDVDNRVCWIPLEDLTPDFTYHFALGNEDLLTVRKDLQSNPPEVETITFDSADGITKGLFNIQVSEWSTSENTLWVYGSCYQGESQSPICTGWIQLSKLGKYHVDIM